MCIERMLALRKRPPGTPLMHQSWHSLTFLHWPIDPADLRRLLPAYLSLDTWEGQAYIGIVPFKMVNIRFARGYPVVGARNFPETNVRTYVIGPNGDPGVWFFSLDAASRTAVAGGRSIYGLPYHFAKMEVEVSGKQVEYRSKRENAESAIKTAIPLEFMPAEPGTLEFWLAERYLLYSLRRGFLSSGQVHHSPYPLAATTAELATNTMFGPLGINVDSEPLVHYSPGVDVEVFRLQRSR